MRRVLLPALMAATASLTAQADEPETVPRTHVESTVVGDSAADDPNAATASASLDTPHQFRAGAPEIMAATKGLNLSPEQTTRVSEIIEKADAGAAALIRRENAVTDMLSSTDPNDPMYPKLVAEHSSAKALWKENREALRQDVLSVLTPPQRERFELQLLDQR